MTPEGKVKRAVKELLNSYRAYYSMPATGGYGNSGTPDFLICHRGKFIAVECKAGKGKVTALQESALLKISACGGIALVINETNINLLATTLGDLT